jgi:hypothetical protein
MVKYGIDFARSQGCRNPSAGGKDFADDTRSDSLPQGTGGMGRLGDMHPLALGVDPGHEHRWRR